MTLNALALFYNDVVIITHFRLRLNWCHVVKHAEQRFLIPAARLRFDCLLQGHVVHVLVTQANLRQHDLAVATKQPAGRRVIRAPVSNSTES